MIAPAPWLQAAAATATTVPSSTIGKPNAVAMGFFFAFISITLGITYWAARRTRTTEQYYAAGRTVSAGQNGLALAGDYMSAASFLGIAGLVSTSGFDGLIYSTGWLVGWPVVLFLIAEPLRNLGKYTFADVVATRLRHTPVRIAAALGTLTTVLFYLIAQMVGAGSLIKLMFGLSYETAVVIVGVAMMAYVLFGGMLATTWVQIIKAVLLLSGASFMAIMVMKSVGFDFGSLFAEAVKIHEKGAQIMSPGGLVSDPVSAISLGLALMFGTAGLPHILMRFFTVSDAKEARKSVFYATGFIGYFYILTFIIGFGAILLVSTNPDFKDVTGAIVGGTNMVAIHLASAVGGNLFLGFISAVAFATILAVVAGLTLAGASAVSHDLYACVIKQGKAREEDEMRVTKLTTLTLGVVAILLGIIFEKQNIAFMVGLAFSIAASCNFPVLFLSMYWKGLSTRGALFGGSLGLFTALLLTIISPTVWVDVFGYAEAIFPYKYPALFSMAAAFIGIWFFSVTDKSKRAGEERERFFAQFVRSQTGLGATGAVAH